jgi:hypothetical protein
MNVHVRFFTVAAFAALAAGVTPLAAQSAAKSGLDQASSSIAASGAGATAVVGPAGASASDSTATITQPTDARGPSLASARVAAHKASSPHGAPPVIQNRSTNRNAVALMAVGGAALVIGAVIGDDAGTLVMLGGAVVGLYGLYLFLT